MNDAISRQAAIDAAIEAVDSWDGGCNIGRQKRIENYINSLPSAQPETTRRIVGKSKGGKTLWYECERCGEPVDEGDKFCRGCGAKMEVEHENN